MKLSQLQLAAAAISRLKKERFLLSLSEREFRDRIVRPVFLRSGLKDGRDLCGPTEEGKDAAFLEPSALGEDLIVVQTKKGNINLAGKAKDNLLTATVQLRTAANTSIVIVSSRHKRRPVKVLLCASGKINPAARRYITDDLNDPRVQFFDADDLIPMIDEKYPEVWLDVDSEVMPYMRNLRRAIEEASESVAIAEMLPETAAAATDDMFVDLYLWRSTLKLRKIKGQVQRIPSFIEIPVTGLPSKPERLVLILGEAGSGKSTSVRRLAYVLAEKALSADSRFQIPISLRAVDLARDPTQSIIDASVLEVERVSESKRPVFGADDLQEGRVAVFIDGLDEVADDSARRNVVRRVIDFGDKYDRCLVVLTSREYSFLKQIQGLTRFTQYRVRKISFKQAASLIQKLEKRGHVQVNSGKELIRRLEEIHGMDLNPLFVTVFAATTKMSRQDIPANITELFKKFTEIMLGRWDATKGFSVQYHAPLKDFILTRIAFEMHYSRVTEMPVSDFRSRVARELRDRGHEANIDELLEEILRSGLLRVVGDRIEFRHLLLQEFYAGRGIPAEDLLNQLVFDDWWRRAVVFYFGDRPGSGDGIMRMRSVLSSRSAVERFTAAGTVGLALQACYLIPLTEKMSGLAEVIDVLATVKDDVAKGAEMIRFPLAGFLTYYLAARDSVALSALAQGMSMVVEKWSDAEDAELSDSRRFWLIVGLLEAGLVSEAEKELRSFHPSDSRLLLAIHLGCILIQKVRVVSEGDKKSAARICKRLAAEIEGLRQEVLKEFQTHLLEMRQGEVAAIPEEN